ncbi:MAG: malonate transporter subunit MadL [Saprospiraceae bacterium]|nr:malonate transporter subunit MadL [Saprospiraceae bacterium]
MTIYGVALLAICYITGQLFGEGLGKMLGIDANVGGVGFAMLMLILVSDWMAQKGFMKPETESGISFWSQMYIPIIVAMAATQNVAAAVSGGLLAVLAGIIPTVVAFALIPLLSRFFKPKNTEGGYEHGNNH